MSLSFSAISNFFSKSLISSLEDFLKVYGTIAHLLWVYQEEKQRRDILQGKCDELRNLGNFYESILENIPIGVVATNKQGYVVLMNQALEEMSRQKKERVLGRKWYEVFGFYGETRKKLESTYWTGKPNYFPEIHLGLMDGGVIPLEMKTTLLRNEKKEVVGVIAICSDLSEKKRLEKEIERSERFSALGQIATGVAHEIRNPLAGINGVLQMLKGRFKKDGEAQYLFDKVFEEIGRLNHVLENLLSLTSPQKLSFEKLRVEDVCKDVLLFAERTFNNHNISFTQKVNGKIPSIYGDKASIKQVILNVVLNAIRAMPKGGNLTIKIYSIETLTQLPKTIFWHQSYLSRIKERLVCPYVCILIKDQGLGISPSEIPKIFEPFYSSNPEGFGLGLFLSSKIMEKHQGLMGVESRFQRGTKFYILFPTK